MVILTDETKHELETEHLPRGTFLYQWGRGRYQIYVYADGEGGEYSECVDEEVDNGIE